MEKSTAIQRATLSLDGLSVGDSFGQQYFGKTELMKAAIQRRDLPEPPWFVTDDTIMAMGIVEVLEQYQEIDQDALARTFAQNYRTNPARGYGGMAHNILREISAGGDWRMISSAVFDGMGSFGNGGAMRVAPLGAYFCDDPQRVVEQARLSAEVTHAHLEGEVGAIAVALAAAFVAASKQQDKTMTGKELLEFLVDLTPASDTRSGINKALSLPTTYTIETVVSALGNGSRISAPDTVPFCLWCVAKHLESYEEALWTTVSGLGDRDTTCAIVGGIVALTPGKSGIPEHWLRSREPRENWKS